MNKLDESSTLAMPTTPTTRSSFQIAEQVDSYSQQGNQESTLRSEVEKSLRRYFQHLENEPVTDLHCMVMSEVEAPLLEAVMHYTRNNQSKASIMLGLNRGTLRTKLKLYGLL
ncbi:MAG: DNA-binding transcriptional regulator Fis [Gammaproteobacteria bacterium]|jgi:Fis family transcriptional regulator|nr:DNA-binding transcriptional regulator Fis [Gammaproteobacteria bacterium]MDP6731844.1 DNA-binding transcriptional regulator Fis [Gammaproteobacteria bacterium]|tara:strand:- start:535 stop:873 length:339 start_codon:yes stop_codon:yes gene_type:complete